MDSMKIYFDGRDILRSPRIALSGKKILVFMQALLVGYADYLITTYLSFALGGYTFSEIWSKYGLYPCLIGNPAPWYAQALYWLGVVVLFLAINFGCTAVSRITYKQLKGDEFYSSGDAWSFVKKHWHPVVFTALTFIIILAFFFGLAAIFALLGKIPYVGEFLFVIPYLLFFFGSVFTIYTGIVFAVSFIYTPAIIGVYEEDTMGTVFNSYSITWSQPWRIIFYHFILLPIGSVGVYILVKAWTAAYGLIHNIFGSDWFMSTKLANVVAYAENIVYPAVFHNMSIACSGGRCYVICSGSCTVVGVDLSTISGTESIAGVILALFLILIGLSVLAYGLSILSVGETLMFVIFKMKSDNDNVLERKDEDDLDEKEDKKLPSGAEPESQNRDAQETEEKDTE